MVLTYLRGGRVGIVSALVAITAIGCSGGKRSNDDTSTTTARGAVTLAPGAETPLTDLAQTVQESNAALASLMSALGGESSGAAIDEAIWQSARLANAAADAIDQMDEREMEQGAGKRIESAGAAAHVSASALADAAGNALEADDGANRVATFGAAVAGGHAAAVSSADAAAELAGAGQICGSKAGLKETLAKASASVTFAKNAGDSAAQMATFFGESQGEGAERERLQRSPRQRRADRPAAADVHPPGVHRAGVGDARPDRLGHRRDGHDHPQRERRHAGLAAQRHEVRAVAVRGARAAGPPGGA